MEIVKTHIDGVLLIKPKVWGDPRGFFVETWQKDRYEAAGITRPFVQDNHSKSSFGILRGLHFQKRNILRGNLFRFPLAESLMSPSISAKNPEHLGNGMALSLHKKINGNYG